MSGRFQAPSADREVLAVPAESDWPALVQRFTETPLPSWGQTLFSELRREARSDFFEQVERYANDTCSTVDITESGPLVLTGHQPELFHPGVWIKNFGVHRVAQQVRGQAGNVIIDNDTMKSSAIRVPAGGTDQFVVGHVPFDAWDAEVPFEERTVVDERVFREFPERVRVTMSKLPFTPMVESYWQYALGAAERTNLIGERLAAGRRGLERSWGVKNLEVPLSRLCETPSFLRLVVELARRARPFQECYNRLLAEYRGRYKVRSAHHPARDLSGSTVVELPFWTWKPQSPDRQSLFVRSDSGVLHFSTPSSEIGSLTVPSHLDERVAVSADSVRRLFGPWKVRPKALMTTLFLRGWVSDFFVHGIGGGKYDEVTDRLFVEFFGWPAPPPMAVLSGTLFLPSRFTGSVDDQLLESKRLARDAYWNPDRHLSDSLCERDPVARWIDAKQSLQSSPASVSRAWTRNDWLQFRELNQHLRPYAESIRRHAEQQAVELADRQKSERAVRSREFASLLHPAEGLRSFFGLA